MQTVIVRANFLMALQILADVIILTVKLIFARTWKKLDK